MELYDIHVAKIIYWRQCLYLFLFLNFSAPLLPCTICLLLSVLCYPSHVIIITKTQFGRTGWEIEEEEEEEEQMKGREQEGGK